MHSYDKNLFIFRSRSQEPTEEQIKQALKEARNKLKRERDAEKREEARKRKAEEEARRIEEEKLAPKKKKAKKVNALFEQVCAVVTARLCALWLNYYLHVGLTVVLCLK